MTEATASSSKPIPLGVKVLAAIGLVYGFYQGVMWMVRKHVDSQIEQNVGQEVPGFTLTDLDGRTWDPAALRGRYAVLNFFRSACPGCRAEKPVLEELRRRVKPESVQILGVMMDRVQSFAPEVTEKTLDWFGYEHPVVMADEAFVDAFHGVDWSHVTPVTYIIDDTGHIVASLRGHQELPAMLKPLPKSALR